MKRCLGSLVDGCMRMVTGLTLAMALGTLILGDLGQTALAGRFTVSESGARFGSAIPEIPDDSGEHDLHSPSTPVSQAFGGSLVAAPVGPEPGRDFVRLSGHVLDILDRARALDEPQGPDEPVTLTFALRRDDPAGFDRYLKGVQDPNSSSYRRFLTQAQITARYGPSRAAYKAVRDYLKRSGFGGIKRSANRLTLTATASRATVNQVLGVSISDYQLGDSRFRANAFDPVLPIAIAPHVLAVGGLSTLSRPHPAIAHWVCSPVGPDGIKTYTLSGPISGEEQACRLRVTAAFGLVPILGCLFAGVVTGLLAAPAAAGAAIAYSSVIYAGVATGAICGMKDIIGNVNIIITGAAPSSTGPGAGLRRAAQTHPATRSVPAADGSGQKIGLLEFDTFNTSDVSNYLALAGASATQINQLSVKPVNGGVASPGIDESEVLLDIDAVMTLAPGADVVVYEAPFTGEASAYVALFNAMINDGVTVISNSWASCEDQVSRADAQSIDTVLQAAAASGISVFNGSGDSGSTCLDGSANTVSVPADSPNATAVGGTSLPQGFGPGGTYGAETWWDDSAYIPPSGQGGFGVSRYFASPSYQSGLNNSPNRSVPDVVTRADPANGVSICQADAGGCPDASINGGTSLAAPEWAAFAALLNQAQGKSLGLVNPALYSLAATDAFHGASSMGTDFAHVGLGSPNLNALNRLLLGQTVGAPVASLSTVSVLAQPATAQILNGAVSVPADGQSTGGVKVTLYDSNGYTVSGKSITLSSSSSNAVISPSPATATTSDSNGAVVFTITDLVAESVTLTATDTTDGLTLAPVTLVFGVPPAANAGISVNPSTLPADGSSAATIIVTLTDSLNRPTPGKAVTISDNGAHAVITGPAAGVTDANGQIQFAATDQINETATFSAVDVTDSNTPVPGSGSVTYSGSAATACGAGVAPVAASGYVVTPYVTGLPAASSVFYENVNFGCPGAGNPAFLSGGQVLVPDALTGGLFETSLAGGTVSTTNLLATIGPTLGNLTFGKDGSLYATQGGNGASIYQINPQTGAVARTVASGLTCPAGLSVDPLSGDLFFDDECTGGGTDNPSIFRVIDPANTNPSQPTSVVVYATLPQTANGGMAFAPNGTLYAVTGYYGNTTAQVEQISPTSASTVTVTPVAGITSDFAVAIGMTNSDGSAQSLIVEPAGTLSEVPIATPSAATVLATGSPGVGVTGPDGCLYSEHYDTIYRLASATGSCGFAPTSPAPSLNLSPGAVTSNPSQGSSQTFTATLSNVNPVSGAPVYFVVTGVNPQFQRVTADAQGHASFTYTAYNAGTDTVVATAQASIGTVTSNSVPLTWTAGPHMTFLSLGSSPAGASVNLPVTVSAALDDMSVYPVVALAGQTVTFTLGGATCTATTNSNGQASCQLTSTQAGLSTLAANFAGTSSYVAASSSSGFQVSLATAPPPMVTLSVNPTSVVAGSAVTLTWSSSNASTCVASGAWSGNVAISGTATETPSAAGSYTYTLTCDGSGGSTAASAALSATPVTVTVRAKSGGGAFDGWSSLGLGLLLLVRRRRRISSAMRGSLLALGLFAIAPGAVRAADEEAAGFYAGARAGTMPLQVGAGKLVAGLGNDGYPGFAASTNPSSAAAMGYLGYAFSSYAGLELGFTHRAGTVVTLSGSVASPTATAALLHDAAMRLSGYGSIYSAAYRAHVEFAPGWTVNPRVGAFYWNTDVTAQAAGGSAAVTHSGGGFTLGFGIAYRVWRALEVGVGADYLGGTSGNDAAFYGASLEWRFGP
jgi:hypothetical protein